MVDVLAEYVLIKTLTRLLAKKRKITLDEARDKIYQSKYIKYLHDEEAGLLGESPFYNLEVFEELEKNSRK